MNPERMKQPRFDSPFSHLLPKTPARSPGAKRVRQHARFYPASRSLCQPLDQFVTECVILEDVCFQKDLLCCAIDGVDHGRKSFFAIEEDGHLVALMNRSSVDAMNQPLELIAAYAFGQRFRQAAHSLWP